MGIYDSFNNLFVMSFKESFYIIPHFPDDSTSLD